MIASFLRRLFARPFVAAADSEPEAIWLAVECVSFQRSTVTLTARTETGCRVSLSYSPDDPSYGAAYYATPGMRVDWVSGVVRPPAD